MMLLLLGSVVLGETFIERQQWWLRGGHATSALASNNGPHHHSSSTRNATIFEPTASSLLAHNEAEYSIWLRRRAEAVLKNAAFDRQGKYRLGSASHYIEGVDLHWLWDLFQPAWSCPERTRLGRISDGGKVLCSVRRLQAMPRCTVAGFGIGTPTELSFEAELLQRTNCSIVLADPTVDLHAVRTHPTWRPMFEGASAGRLRLNGVALAPTDGSITLNVAQRGPVALPAWSLERHMRQAGVSHVAVLKVDVEGAEFAVVKRWASTSPRTSGDTLKSKPTCCSFLMSVCSNLIVAVLRRIDEIVVEIHRNDACVEGSHGFAFPTKTECDVRYVFELFESLESHGFRIFSQEPNLINGRRVAEFSLVKQGLFV